MQSIETILKPALGLSRLQLNARAQMREREKNGALLHPVCFPSFCRDRWRYKPFKRALAAFFPPCSLCLRQWDVRRNSTHNFQRKYYGAGFCFFPRMAWPIGASLSKETFSRDLFPFLCLLFIRIWQVGMSAIAAMPAFPRLSHWLLTNWTDKNAIEEIPCCMRGTMGECCARSTK